MTKGAFQDSRQRVTQRPPEVRLASDVVGRQTEDCIDCQRPKPQGCEFTSSLVRAVLPLWSHRQILAAKFSHPATKLGPRPAFVTEWFTPPYASLIAATDLSRTKERLSLGWNVERADNPDRQRLVLAGIGLFVLRKFQVAPSMRRARPTLPYAPASLLYHLRALPALFTATLARRGKASSVFSHCSMTKCCLTSPTRLQGDWSCGPLEYAQTYRGECRDDLSLRFR